ncbi:MAG: cupin domain-containing protein, partial [Anaerolineaceae bacterium]|nr:cupin domain-containing protein [Anaerolineaceae bacterium]
MATRRVVTGNNSEGKSYFVHDGLTPEQGMLLFEGIWLDDPANPDPAAIQDQATSRTFQLEPPKGGSSMRVWTFYPEGWELEFTQEEIENAWSRFDVGDAFDDEDNPGMHTTHTIDYGIVLSGEIDLELDEGTVHLKSGDMVVQRGTRHDWHNPGPEPCIMAVIMISSIN